jgi:hypothetical protein
MEALYEAFDQYLKVIDSSPVDSTSIFRKENDKEIYETYLMFMFRKYQQACYHAGQIDSYIENESQQSLEPTVQSINPSHMTTVSVYRDSNHFIYELTAFLTSLKSSLDFLTAICRISLDESIKDSWKDADKFFSLTEKHGEFLVNSHKKHKNKPIYRQVDKFQSWYSSFSKYRNELVHNKMVRTSSGHHWTNQGGNNYLPPFVAEKTPKFEFDTRRTKALNSKPYFEHFDLRTSSQGNVDGIHSNYSMEFLLPEGYVRVNEFAHNHLSKFNEFASAIINDLKELNFQKFQQALKN